MASSKGKRTAARFLTDGSSRTSSLLVPFDDLFFDRVLLDGTRRSPVVGLGGASEPQNTGRLHFAALRLLLIIYAASERETLYAVTNPVVIAAHVCCTAKRESGPLLPRRRYRHYRTGYRESRTGENRANPIESCNRFAQNNNHDWIPRSFGGRTLRFP